MSILAKKIRCGFKRKKSSVFIFIDDLFSARTSSSDHSQRATHLNQFQETLGTRKNQFPEKRSAGKNQLFFFLFDVFDFSRNSSRLTDF
jgi:hypothetical protein